MNPLVSEGVNLIVRWAHLIAGIMWIGSSIFFHWLDSHMEKPPEERKGLEGVLWMVHSGGFYEVEKKLVAPGELPKNLHWFKWEAAFTWMTGFFLLILLYHLGGGVLLVDAAHPVVDHKIATVICLGTLVVAWFAYDALWMSKLSGTATQNPPLTVAISVIALAAIAFAFTHFLSGRAAYIHTAAVMGTCMVLNVWVRIIPAQRNLVESVRAGVPPNAAMAYSAKRRSKHNHYMTYPVLFIMISNHFPSTYGNTAAVAGTTGVGMNWLILVVVCALGAAVKLWLNKTEPSAGVGLAALGILAAIVAGGSIAGSLASSSASSSSSLSTDHDAAVASANNGKPIGATGKIHGTVTWKGDVPPAREVALYGGCETGHDGPVKIPVAVVGANGALAEAFVAVTGGVDGYAVPPPPSDPVVVEQKGCLYAPRVSGVRAGQPIAFVNDDNIFHNVRSVAAANESFAINQPAQGQRDVKTFRKPELMVETRCDIHPWMVSHVGVVDHPWFAVTKDDGAFTLDGVPAGDVELTVWSDAGGKKTQKVTVPAGGDVAVDIAFGPGAGAAAGAGAP